MYVPCSFSSSSSPVLSLDDIIAQLMPIIDRIVEEKVEQRLAEEREKLKQEILASLRQK